MPVAIPALGWMVVLFAAFVGYVVARGLLATWTHSIGWLLQWLAVHARLPIRLRHVGSVVIDLGRPFRAADHAVLTALQTWAEGAETEMGYALHGLAQIWDWTVQATEEMAREMERFDSWLVGEFIPRHVSRRLAPVAREAKRADNRARDAQASTANLAHVHPHVDRRTGARVTSKPHDLAARVDDALHGIDELQHRLEELAGAVAVPHQPGAVVRLPAWRGLTRRAARTERRLARLERVFGATAAAAIIANALGLGRNWRCIGRGNIGRLARHACRAPKWLIDLLVLGTIEAFVASDLCRFTDLLAQATEEVQPALFALVDVENALVGCHGAEAPRVLALPPVSLPPLVDAVTLAA